MKRFLAFILALMMVLSLVACGGGSKATNESPEDVEIINFDDASTGIIKFGTYKQNKYQADGSKPITWMVLESDDNSIVLLSLDILDCHKFDSETTIWRDSDVRKWLNGTFLSTAFTEKEQSYIATSTISTLDREGSSITTEDRVYLLSSEELELYYPGRNDNNRLGVVTEYAVDNGLKAYNIFPVGNTCNWWLRDAAPYSGSTYVGGQLGNYGEVQTSSSSYDQYGIRPVIVINK